MTQTIRPTGRQPTLTTDLEDDVLVVTIDAPGAAVNTLSPALAAEFEDVFRRAQDDSLIKGLVLISGKPEGFIAGADIEQFPALRTAAAAESISQMGHSMLRRLELLRVPVVAAVHGAALGGGLELLLACRYRVCTDHPKTTFALPEVQLGLIPGIGGTQRLPRRVGLQAALDMILTGRSVRAKRALQMGLVDEMVHPAILREISIARARAIAAGTLKPSRSGSHGPTSFLLERNPIGRSVVFKKARESVLEKTAGHYPAPLAALSAVQAGYQRGFDEGLKEE